jgi:hypothetical protein
MDPPTPSAKWLQTLQEGDVLSIDYEGYEEELLVVRKPKKWGTRWSVVLKRPHLKQLLPMTERGDYVQYQLCPHHGNRHWNISDFKVRKQTQDVAP